jgi:thiopurine S-methyltransferase
MTGRDKQNWLRMWRKDQTDFHQQSVNPLLMRFWGSLELNQPSRIFVPLCGKSQDLLWLAQQGHEVVGVELSPVAVKAFFDENGLTPSVCRRKNYTVWEHGRLKILCGDFFSLDPVDLGAVDVVYDRAALTALPEQVRKQYVTHMRGIVPLDCSIFLLTIEDGCQECVPALLTAPDEAVDDEIETLYAPYFVIQIAHAEAAWETDPASPGSPAIAVLHKVYRLHPKT